MEIYKIKKNSVSVIFTGSHYYFFTDWSGLFAIAERDYTKQENNESHFSLRYGNEHLTESFCRETAKAFIQKAERKYVPNKLILDELTFEELNKTTWVDVTAKAR